VLLGNRGEAAKATKVHDNLLKALKKRGEIITVMKTIVSRRDGSRMERKLFDFCKTAQLNSAQVLPSTVTVDASYLSK